MALPDSVGSEGLLGQRGFWGGGGEKPYFCLCCSHKWFMNGTSYCSWKRLQIRAEELFGYVTERVDCLDPLFTVESRSQGTLGDPHPRISQLTAGAGANAANPCGQCEMRAAASHVLRDAAGSRVLAERGTSTLR